jgi:glycogen synthase
MLRASVVITACTGTPGLRRTLLALRRQTHPDFEVIALLGPPAALDQALAELAEVKAAPCPEANLSRARNRGVSLASGDVVAFLEGGALPDPRWLEALLAGYDSATVGGVGGFPGDPVRGPGPDPLPAVCDRSGNRVENVPPPFWGYTLPRADRFLHLPASNASFRRRCLEEAGGFDEGLESSYGEADLCMRLVDRGYRLRVTAAAVVHHIPEPAPSNEPRRTVQDRTYFALRARPADVPLQRACDGCWRFGEDLVRGAAAPAELPELLEEVDRGVWLGIARGMNGPRRLAALPSLPGGQFRVFPTVRARPQALTICYVSPEPVWEGDTADDSIWELARGVAARGHEVHFLAPAESEGLDLEDGVWVHRLPAAEGGPWCTPELTPAARRALGWATAAHREVLRLRRSRVLDLVSVALRGSAGLFCLLDDNLSCVLSLDVPPCPPRRFAPLCAEELAQMGALEQLALRSARHRHRAEPHLCGGEAAVEQALRAYADVLVRTEAA